MADVFLNRGRKTMSNTHTDGQGLYLFGNKIAEWREDGLYVSNAGWFTRTTKERLNALGLNIYQEKFEWYLNGVKWDGNWIKVF